MKICPNCDQKVEGFHVDCPNCGYQLLTPEQAQKALVALDKMKDFILNLDMSQEGISKTVAYVDNVTKALEAYQNILLLFMEEHKEVETKRKKLGDKPGSMKAQTYLLMMNTLWINTDNKNFSVEIIASSLPGCYSIRQQLIAIKNLTETLLSDYANFFNHEDPSGLEKSKKSIGEISQHLELIWPEIEKINTEITTFLDSSKQ